MIWKITSLATPEFGPCLDLLLSTCNKTHIPKSKTHTPHAYDYITTQRNPNAALSLKPVSFFHFLRKKNKNKKNKDPHHLSLHICRQKP